MPAPDRTKEKPRRTHKRRRQPARQRNGYSVQRVDAMGQLFHRMIMNDIMRDYVRATSSRWRSAKKDKSSDVVVEFVHDTKAPDVVAAMEEYGALAAPKSGTDGGAKGLSHGLAKTLNLAACLT